MSDYKEDVINCDHATYPNINLTDAETEYKKDVINCDDVTLIKKVYNIWRGSMKSDEICFDLETNFPTIILPHGKRVPASEVRLLCETTKSLSTKICTDDSCVDVKTMAPIVSSPHQKEISAIKNDSKVSKVECVSEFHNINLTGEELFHYVFNLISPMMMKPAPEPTGELYNFTEKKFQDFFENKPELMLCVLSSYSANRQIPRELIELEQYIAELPIYHTITTEQIKLKESFIKESFFKTFQHTHFKYKATKTPNKRYCYDVVPTSKLLCCNADAFKCVSTFLDRMSGIFKGNGFANKLKNLFDGQRLSKIKVDEKKDAISIIKSSFKTAWDHQADTYQTNATITGKSIRKLTDHMVEKKILLDNSLFLDCGSSYGSLLLNVVNICKDKNISIKGYGIEYAKIRHSLGCESMVKCIEGSTSQWISDMNFNVEIVHRNLLDYFRITKEGLNHDTNGSRIMFAFDKAFDGNLLIHLTLLAINSDDIDFFITCRETFESKKHKCHLETKSFVNENGKIGGVTRNGFFHRELLDHMKFKHHSKVSNVFMNGSNESAGTFHIYDIRHCHKTIDNNFLKELWTTFLSKNGISEEAMHLLYNQWERTQSKVFHPTSFPKSRNDITPSTRAILEYYKNECKNNCSGRVLRKRKQRS